MSYCSHVDFRQFQQTLRMISSLQRSNAKNDTLPLNGFWGAAELAQAGADGHSSLPSANCSRPCRLVSSLQSNTAKNVHCLLS